MNLTNTPADIIRIVAQELDVCGCGELIIVGDIKHRCLCQALIGIGWLLHDVDESKFGKSLKFRKAGFNSEIRVIYRGPGDFEAEHIKQPDPIGGEDKSFCFYITVSQSELLRHLAHTK